LVSTKERMGKVASHKIWQMHKLTVRKIENRILLAKME